MWFLIGEQITRAENHLNRSTTMEQLLEGLRKAGLVIAGASA
jgi:hypothetical protein